MINNDKDENMSSRVEAKILGLGKFYKDGLEALEIWIPKKKANALPYVENQGVSIDLYINNKCYETLLRSTERMKYVWISPKLFNQDEERCKLANVLQEEGFNKNQNVYLKVEGKKLYLMEK